MKKTILLIALCHIQFCFAQDTDSLIKVKGYYVTRYLKPEIIFSYEQKIKKERKESYATPIDYTQFSFFVPVQIGSEIVCEEDAVAEKFLDQTHSNSICYVIPHKHYNDFLKKINVINTDVSKETCILSEIWSLSPYYEASGNNEFLFKCIYMEGYVLRKHIKEIEEHWQNYLCYMLNGSTNKKDIEFFFIVKINDYTPYIEIPELKKWFPYLE